MRYILDRLREPSTYAGIAALFAGFGLFGLSEAAWNEVFALLAAAAGTVAIFLGDNDHGDDGFQE